MPRTIEAYKLHTKLEVDAGTGIRELQRFEKQINSVSGVFKSGLGVISPQGLAGLKQMEGFGASLRGMAGPASALVGVVSGLTAGLTGAGAALFTVVKNASEAGGQINDLRIQTGLGAETLSALKYAADQSGGSIDEIATASKNLSLMIAEAARGSEDATKKLKRLGIDPVKGLQDLDYAMGQAMKSIAGARPGIEQTERAADAFGKKLGPGLIPTIQSFGGNLDQLTKDVKELGLSLSDTDAQQLDAFGDQLDTLSKQMTGFANQFAIGVVPELTRGMAEMSDAHKKHGNVARQWGEDFAAVIRGARETMKGDLGFITKTIIEDSTRFLTGYGAILTLLKKIGGTVPAAQLPGATEDIKGGASKIFGPGRVVMEPDEPSKKGKAAAKEKKDELAGFKRLLEDLQLKQKRFGDETEVTRVKTEFQRLGIEKLTGRIREQAEAIKARALIVAQTLDVDKQVAELRKKQEEETKQATEAFAEFYKQQKQELDEIQGRFPTAIDNTDRAIAAFEAAGGKIDEVTKSIMRLNAATIDAAKSAERAGETYLEAPWTMTEEEIDKATQKRIDRLVELAGPPPELKKKLKIDWEGMADQLEQTFGQAFSNMQSGWDSFSRSTRGGVGQPAQKQKGGLFAKILGMAAPFLSFIPGIGPIASMAAGMISSGLQGNWQGVASGALGGLRPGGALRTTFSRPAVAPPIVATPISSLSTITPFPRQGGGPVFAGHSYVVGEGGRELLTPGFNGTITPNSSAPVRVEVVNWPGSMGEGGGGSNRWKGFATGGLIGALLAGGKRRARGGPVYRGQRYIVGESGWETFTPAADGYITPHGASAPGGGGGAMAAGLAELRAAIMHLRSMPPDHVVMRGANGLVRAMDHDAGLIRLVGQRQRLA